MALIFVLQVLWSARLTFHAIRRGFFKKGEEDYRWPVLRQRMPRWAWEVFALFFIAIAQNILLALTALPQYMILTSTWHKINRPANPATVLTRWDYLLAILTVFNLALEMASDQQQWTYQNYKRGKDASLRDLPPAKAKTLSSDPDVKRGFLTKGLWAYSRHPNFYFEQINWWLFWAYVVVTFAPNATTIPWATFLQCYATVSPVLMNILFISSTSRSLCPLPCYSNANANALLTCLSLYGRDFGGQVSGLRIVSKTCRHVSSSGHPRPRPLLPLPLLSDRS